MRNYAIKSDLTNVDHKSNYTTIDRYIETQYYQKYLEPAHFLPLADVGLPSTPATYVAVQATPMRYGGLQFTNGNTDDCIANFLIRPEWIEGKVEITIFYTGDTASTNNILWSVASSATENETTLMNLPFAQSEVTPGPSAAWLLKRYTFSTYITVAREKELMSLRLFRESGNVADTYAGDVFMLMMKLRLIPSKIQYGTQVNV